MSTQSLVIKTRVTGGDKTVRTLQDVNKELKDAADNAKGVEGGLSEMSINAELLKSIQSLVGGMERMNSSMDQVRRGLSDMGVAGQDTTKNLDRGFLGLSSKAAVFGAAIGLAKQALTSMAVPVKLAADLQTNIAAITTVSNVSEDTLNAVKALGTQVPQAMSDVAKAAYDALSAQISEADLIPLLKTASELATLGMTDLTSATNLSIVAMSAFGSQGLSASEAGDIFFATVQRGRTTMDELAAAFPAVASTAAAFGISLQETNATLATLTKAGNSAETSAVQLNAIMTTLAKPSKEAAVILNALGVETGATALANNGLIGTLEQVIEKTAGQNDIILKLFPNIRALKGGAALLSDGLTTLKADFAAISNAAGVVDRNLSKVQNTTNSAKAAFDAISEGALVDLGNTVLPLLQSGLTSLTDWFKDDYVYMKEGLTEGFGYLADYDWTAVAAGIGLIAAAVTGPLGIAAVTIAGLVYELKVLSDMQDERALGNKKAVVEAQKESQARVAGVTREVAALGALSQKRFATAKQEATMAAYSKAWRENAADLNKKSLAIEEKIRVAREAAAAQRVAITLKLQEYDREGVKKSNAGREAEMLGMEAKRRALAAEGEALQKNLAKIKEFKKASTDAYVGAGPEIAKARAARAAVSRAEEEEKNAKKRRRQAVANAKKRAAAVAMVLLRAQEEELSAIADSDARALALLRLRHRRAMTERVALMGEEHASVMSLKIAQAEELSNLEVKQAKRIAVAKKRIADADARADKARQRQVAHAEATRLKETIELYGVLIDSTNQAAASATEAALRSAIYGGSVKDALNDVMEGIALESTVKAVFEAAEAAASAAVGNVGGVALHGRASAQYAAVAILAGGAAAATGGFNGPSNTSADSSSKADVPVASGPKPRQEPNGNGGVTNLNLNFGGSMPLVTKRGIGIAVADALKAADTSLVRPRYNTDNYKR